MSKKAVKDTSISSKLLGANLADINIQKFRDISQYNKNKYELGGRVTIPLLKTVTNKFSPAIMFTLVLPNQGIGSIDALAECENLMMLNLSKNGIENIGPLKNSKKLKIVDLKDNSITNVDSLSHCSQLVNIHLEGNMIKSLESIGAFSTCPKLKNLHLQTLSGDLQNPICQLNNYRNNVFDAFVQVSRIDGIPKGIQLSNGSQLKLGKKKQLKIQLKSIGPFYTNKFPSTAQFVPPSFPGEQPLKKGISSCKSAISDLQIQLKAALAM